MKPQKRTGLLIGAIILATVGVIVAAAGITGVVADQKRDADGYFSANAHRYESKSRAIASEGIDVGGYVPTFLAGDVRLGISSEKPVFVGIAPKRAVDRYLAGIDHDEATNLGYDPFEVTYVHRPGAKAPGRPADELFWAATSTGTSQPLTWDLRSGNWSVVVMNADGSPGVSASISPGVEVPALLWVSIGAAILGAALLAAAGLMAFGRPRAYRGETPETAALAG